MHLNPENWEREVDGSKAEGLKEERCRLMSWPTTQGLHKEGKIVRLSNR